MSNNIIIQETGLAKRLYTISEIETAEQGGGTITWVPEEERKVIKKTITAKGKYKASDDNAYAYSEVVVNISGSANAEKEDKKPFSTIAPDITIQEGGVGKKMYNIKKLVVSEADSDDTCSWIPEDNVKTDTLSVSGNGTFKASDYGCYGWTEVTVSKKAKKVVRKDDGNEYVEYEDGTEEKIPSSIKVTTPPDKTTYLDAEPINTSGMIVTAYYGDGTEYGVVDGWKIDPIVADLSKAGDSTYTDGNGVVAKKVTYRLHRQIFTNYYGQEIEHTNYSSTERLGETESGVPLTVGGEGVAEVLVTKYNHPVYGMTLYAKRISGEAKAFGTVKIFPSPYHYDDGRSIETSIGESFVYINHGGSAYQTTTSQFTRTPWSQYITEVPESTSDPEQAGEMVGGSGQPITVIWTRPADETDLTDTFDITVDDPTPII